MNIEDFIKQNNVDYSSNRIAEQDISIMEILLGVSFGKQLRQYITQYGYLGFEYVELFGINGRQGTSSDMIQQTQYLHKYFKKTLPYIALEDQGDGDYYLLDQNDTVYRFLSSKDEIICQDIQLFDYILKRFSEVKGDI